MVPTTIYVIESQEVSSGKKVTYFALRDKADAESICEILAKGYRNFSYSVNEVLLFT